MASLSQLPQPLIEKICQFLVTDISDVYNFCFGIGVLHVLNLRATCHDLNEKVKQSRVEIYLRFKDWNVILTKASPWNLLETLNKHFDWQCCRMTVDVPGPNQIEAVIGKIDLCIGPCNDIFASRLRFLSVYIPTSSHWQHFYPLAEKLEQLLSPVSKISLKTGGDFPLDMKFEKPHFDIFPSAVYKVLVDFVEIYDESGRGSNPYIAAMLDAFPNIEELEFEQIVPLLQDVTRGKKLRKHALSSICLELYDQDWPKLTGQFPSVQVLQLTQQESDNIYDVFPFLTKNFPNLTFLELVLESTDGDLKSCDSLHLDLPACCRTVKIDYYIMPCIVQCKHIKNLVIVWVDDDLDRSELDQFFKRQIKKLTANLETFALIRHELKSFCDYLSNFAFLVLNAQPSLEAVAFDFWPSFKTYKSGNRIRTTIFKPDFWSNVKKWLRKNRECMETHPNLKLFRFRDKFLVLKSCVDFQLISKLRKIEDNAGALITGGMTFSYSQLLS